MRDRVLFWLGITLSALVYGCAPASSRLLSPGRGGPTWTRVETANFRVFTDLQEADAKRIALQLERDLDALGQAAFESVRPAVGGTDVIVFAEREAYHRFAHKSTEGVFYQRLPLDPESSNTVVTFGGINDSTRTRLLHELTHDLFERNFGAAPTWLNEGWAEYYSTVHVADGKVLIGEALPEMTLTNDREPFLAQVEGRQVVAIPIADLPSPSQLMALSSEDFYEFSANDDPSTEESMRRMARYLGAWALVHMLLDGHNPYAERFKVFQREALDSRVQEAWARAFAGVKSEELDRYFRSYLATSKLSVFGVPYKNNVVNQVLAKPLSDGEVHLLWARLHSANLGDSTGDAAASVNLELEDAVKATPDLAEAHYWQGLFRLFQQRWEAAHAAFARAATLAPDDPRVLWSQLRLEFLRRNGVLQPTELAELLPKFERLVALAKSSQQLIIAAHYHHAQGKAAQAIALIERAVRLDPIDPAVLDNYATLLAGSGRLKEALEVQRRALAFVSDGEEEQGRVLRQHLEVLEAQAVSQP